MKIFVATRCGQGLRKHDLCNCNEGEWVYPPVILKAKDRLQMTSFHSLNRTTTFRAIELPITRDYYLFRCSKLLMDNLSLNKNQLLAMLDECKYLLSQAKMCQEHWVMERVGHKFSIRLKVDTAHPVM